MRLTLLVAFALSFIQFSHSQTPSPFGRTYTHRAPLYSANLKSIIHLSSGSFIACGTDTYYYTGPGFPIESTNDAYELIKFNSNLDTVWTQKINWFANSYNIDLLEGPNGHIYFFADGQLFAHPSATQKNILFAHTDSV